MTPYDYTIATKFPDGTIRATTYQRLIKDMEIQDEQYEGQPLSEGGTPQALFIKGLIEKLCPKCEVKIYYQGNQIL